MLEVLRTTDGKSNTAMPCKIRAREKGGVGLWRFSRIRALVEYIRKIENRARSKGVDSHTQTYTRAAHNRRRRNTID